MNSPRFGGMLFVALVVGCAWLGAAESSVRGAEPLTPERAGILFEEARQLQRDGKSREAFLKYMLVPGGEAAAIAVTRTGASVAEFLELLRKNAGSLPTAQAKLVEGELSLALKNREWALACFREAAALIGRKAGAEREPEMLPREDYFVEPVVTGAERAFYHEQLFPPFTLGPGSHRDNRLIRRFIALEAWDDASREFARVWELHREASQPFVRAVPVWIEPTAAENATSPADALQAENTNPFAPHQIRWEKRLFRPAGFNGQGLQFALDYAFFLQRRNEPAVARSVLLEPLLAIDMDRDPNSHSEGKKIPDDQPLPAPERPVDRQQQGHFGRASGVSRKEFIRLVYGDFQSRGQAAELVTALNERIKAGENRARRTLARIRGHQGLPEDALALELAYIAAGNFDPLTTAYRKGLVLDEARKIPEATAEFERVLSLPAPDDKLAPDDKIANVPDPDEVTSDGGQFGQYSQAGGGRFHSGHAAAMNQLHPLAIQHLQRLYAAQGATIKLLDLTLRQAESQPQMLAQVESLEQLIQKFRAAKQEARMTRWIKQRLEEAKDPNAVAALAWVTGDLSRAAKAVAASTNREQDVFGSGMNPWKERFRKVGTDQLKMLLTLIVQANPKDGRSRLELLELEGRLEGVEAMESLELLLAGDATPAFVHGKGQRNRTQFTGYGDLAYRLMRLYERHEKLGELRQLGLRIAREEKPFDRGSLRRYSGSSDDENAALANACLALAIQYANDRADQTALADALQDSDWPAARNQIARRRAGPWKPQPAAKPIPWANAPAGVSLLVSHDNVLCLAHNDRFVYSGHPWGVAVYTHAGQAVTQIALGEAARTMLVQGGQVWVGTPKGLFRVTPGEWTVAHQSLLADMRSTPTRLPESKSGVHALAIDGDLLWLGLPRNVQVLNTKTLELRAYSQEEMKLEHPGDVSRIFVDGRYVWAVGEFGTRRWDRTTDEWSAVESVGPRDPTRLVAIVDGIVFGDAYIDDRLRHRLCVIDRETLKVTPIPIPIIARPGRELVNQPFQYLGKSQGLVEQKTHPDCDGKHLFTGESTTYYLDKQSQTLKPLPESVLQSLHERLYERESKRSSADPRLKAVLRMLDQRDEFVARVGAPQVYDWTEMTLPNGTLVAGHRLGRTRFEYPDEDRRTWSDSLQDLDDAAGGLFFIADRDQPDDRLEQRILARNESPLRADRVYGLVTGDDHVWLCTDRGLVVLNRDGRVVDRVSRLEGLCANRVVGGATLGGRTYFATAWDDSSGGLAVFDPLTATFTSLHQGDGLSTDKLQSVGVKDDHLTLTFGPEYLRYSNNDQFRWRQFPPAIFDPKTNTFTAGGPPQLSKNEPPGRTPIGGVADPFEDAPDLNEASPENDLFGTPTAVKRPNKRAMPFLGGTVLHRQSLGGKTIMCGTRGVVIEDTVADRAGKSAGLTVALLGARLVPSVASQQLADAVSRKPVVGNLGELKAALQDENPLYRANAIAMLHGQKTFPANDAVPLIAGQLNDPNRRLRCTALVVLIQFKEDNLVVPLLTQRLKDTDRNIRCVAMLELTRRGNVPQLPLLREFFRKEDHVNFPFGAESTVGVKSSFHEMHAALAPHATNDIFQLLLQNPPHPNSYDNERAVFPQLGRSLLRHPDAVASLLKVRADEYRHDEPVEFVRNVFGSAGKGLLPPLHAALHSEDRVIRSNAARGCGAIRDPSSIEPLINALDLESGLSRASIIWALGELKAKAALPAMARMYVDARNDEDRRGSSGSGAGFRASQSGAVMAAQFESLKSLDAIGADWNELKPSDLAASVDPRHQEDLFEPSHVLEAVAKIGAAESQTFYRTLSAESDDEFRAFAAIQLAEAGPDDRELNIPILKSLLAGDSPNVRIAAAASLLILGQNEGRQPMLDALTSDEWGYTLQQLERAGAGRCAFARKEIKAIADDSTKTEVIRNMANNLLRTQNR